MIQEPDLSEIS